MLTRRHAEWLTVAFFVTIVAVVFHQIATSMTEQGIASGSPYDNAAAYPRAVAVLIGIMIAGQAILLLFRPSTHEVKLDTGRAGPAAVLLAIFAAYLLGLGFVGYHIATPLMIFLTMYAGGLRRIVVMVVFSMALSLGVAFCFEVFLKIVLPGGVFGLSIHW